MTEKMSKVCPNVKHCTLLPCHIELFLVQLNTEPDGDFSLDAAKWVTHGPKVSNCAGTTTCSNERDASNSHPWMVGFLSKMTP